MKRILFIILMTCSFGFVSLNATAQATDVFNQMKSLVGTWVKTDAPDSNFSVAFELTANDSVLIETWLRGDKKHSLTLYHLNGNELIATHYCPQGNQPRLQMSKDSKPNHVEFSYLDATNLNSLDDSHQHSLGFDLSDSANKILRKESYLNKDGEEFSEMVLVRNSMTMD